MTAPFRVGVVLSPSGWSERLHAYVADHVPDVELRVVRDRRAALDEGPHVLLLDASTAWLTEMFVADAESAGVRVVGVYDRSDGGRSRDRLAGLGLTHLIEEAMPAEDAMFLLARLRPADTGAERRRWEAAEAPPVVDAAIIPVGGPSGSGARELAIGLAARWAEAGWSTLLVDANETTAGVARRLGLGLYPHLLAAVERCGTGIDGVRTALADTVRPLPFDVITGLATPRDWDRLVPSDVAELLSVCRQGWDRVVVTTSPLVEDLARWGNRFGVSRHLLTNADMVVGAAEPTPRGVLRYLDWFTDLGLLRGDVVTVLNKVPSSPRVSSEARQQLLDVGGSLVDDLWEVPLDKKVAAAEWDGRLVANGRFRKSLVAIVDELEQRLLVQERAALP